jgi:hypothetical protein
MLCLIPAQRNDLGQVPHRKDCSARLTTFAVPSESSIHSWRMKANPCVANVLPVHVNRRPFPPDETGYLWAANPSAFRATMVLASALSKEMPLMVVVNPYIVFLSVVGAQVHLDTAHTGSGLQCLVDMLYALPTGHALNFQFYSMHRQLH